ncbi:MAG: thioredoxin family protein [Armatimonadetes bacterium]|jgi:thioredoxin-related protein|nr:thioredoxin family protein [Armatimonadota bacterium]
MFRQEKPAAAPKPTKTVISDATKAARKQKKNVFIHFGASWCGWCRLLEKVIAQPEVKALLEENYVMVELVALENGPKKVLENAGSNEFMTAMGGAKSGLPFLVFLDDKGKKLADSNVMPKDQNIGCPAAPEEIAAFGELLKKTAPRLSDAKRQTILDAFTKAAPKR